MMGRSHVVSGAAAWLGGCAVLSGVGHHPHPVTIIAGTAVAAGAALLPDADHPSSTLAWSLGPVTRWVCRRVGHLSARVHAVTSTPLDRPSRDGHRTLSHTAVAAVATGLVVALAAWLGGTTAAAVIIWVGTAISVRAVVSRRQRGAFGAAGAGILVTGLSVVLAVGGWWWLGAAATVGMLAHLAGDAATNSGCPILWPIRIGGRRWFRVGTPVVMRIGTGGAWERLLVVPLLLVAGVGSVVLLVV